MGVLYARESGAWVPVAGQGIGVPAGGVINQVLSKASATDYDTSWANLSWVVQTPFLIPDPVGVTYPALRFQSGDGGNGVGPNPYHYEFNLYNDVLRLYSNRSPSIPVVEFARPASGAGELRINANWAIEDRNDGYLRFFYGADRVSAEAYMASDGGFGCGPVSCASLNASGWITTQSNVTVVGRNILGGGGFLYLQGNGTPNPMIQIGAANGAPGPMVYLACFPAGNNWSDRPLCVAKHSGAGECGIGFVNHTTGYTGAFQLYSDGAWYIAAVNGANSATMKMQASQFQVVSTGRFKADRTVLTPDLVRRLIERVAPVRFRDLQHEMAIAAASPPAPNVVREPQPPMEPQFRFGLIAEEVAEVAPELTDDGRYGMGLDLSGLVAVLWQAVKDLRAEVAALQSATP